MANWLDLLSESDCEEYGEAIRDSMCATPIPEQVKEKLEPLNEVQALLLKYKDTKCITKEP